MASSDALSHVMLNQGVLFLLHLIGSFSIYYVYYGFWFGVFTRFLSISACICTFLVHFLLLLLVCLVVFSYSDMFAF